VLVGIGGSLSISGLIAFLYYQEHNCIGACIISHRYGPYSLPILFIGICALILSMVAFYLFKRSDENKNILIQEQIRDH